MSALFVSDGSMSHPNSKRYPPEARRTLREREATEALEILGVVPGDIHFLRLPDTRVPVPSSENFNEAVALVHEQLAQLRPETVLVPWRRDPHGDHRATWHLLQAAVARFDAPLRWLEYPIWVWESTQSDDLPTAADGSWFRVDVSEFLSQKRRAIAAHVSQTTPLIDDDPEGFTLSPEDDPSFYPTLRILSSTMSESLSTEYFDDLYQKNEDPWDFETSAYERDKYAATLAALPNAHYQNAFEIGCSIGVLTQQLAVAATICWP